VHREWVHDWNVFLGVHFASNPDTAHTFACGHGRIIVAELHGNLYVAGCESARMTPEAAKLAFERGIVTARELEQVVHNGPDAVDEDRREASQLRAALERDGAIAFSDAAHEGILSYMLGADPQISKKVADCYRADLEERGYAGVLYENAYEGGGVCAIAFASAAIEIVSQMPAREFSLLPECALADAAALRAALAA
jgi:hypothetical protein